jgi:hypothetical protein
MLYTSEGNLRSEDQTLRRIARRTVRAALDKMDAETERVVNALIAHIGTNSSCKMGADELLLLVNRHPRLQPERSTINRYMDAFPELKETTLSACQAINRKTLGRLQTFLAPREYARRFANTKGAYRI